MEYLYLNSLKRVGSYFSVSYQYALLELTADKLRIVDGYFDLYSNTALSIMRFRKPRVHRPVLEAVRERQPPERAHDGAHDPRVLDDVLRLQQLCPILRVLLSGFKHKRHGHVAARPRAVQLLLDAPG